MTRNAHALGSPLGYPVFNGSVESHVRNGAITGRQRGLLEAINDEPALNIQELAGRMRVQRTAAKHHVRALIKQGYVVTLRQGRHVMHFTKWMPPNDRKALALLRIGSVRALVAIVFEQPGIPITQVHPLIGVSSRTVRATVRLLRHQNLLRIEKSMGQRARQLHLERDTRLVWAHWFDPARDRAVPPLLTQRPTRMAAIGLFVLSWLFPWNS